MKKRSLQDIDAQIKKLKEVRKNIAKKTNASVGRQYKKNGHESWSWSKFLNGMFALRDSEGWGKDISGIFNVRKLVMYGIVLIIVATYFYVQGRGTKPVKIDIGYGKEAILEVNEKGDHVYIDKKGFVYFRDKDENILKQLSVADIPGLKKKLSPIGFQLQPIFVGGVGLGVDGVVGEVGAGVSFFRYWKMQLEVFLTQYGIYAGTSYKITDNSGTGLAIGKGWYGDDRMIWYYRFNF